jgi:glutathione S-transferase
MVHYKLYYFDIRGRAEPIRLILQYAGQKYDEERFTFANWADNKSRFPYGHVPVLEVDGKQLAETVAIARYLARQYGLAGPVGLAWEQGKVDEFADFHKDVGNELEKYTLVAVGIVPGDKVRG